MKKRVQRPQRPIEKVLRAYLKKNAAWVEKRFGHPGDFLGCGSWGCAWMLGQDVLKLTTDPSEAANVALLSKKDDLPGVVETWALCRGPEGVPSWGDRHGQHSSQRAQPVWLYLREYIDPLTRDDEAKLKVYSGGKTALEMIQKAGWKWLRASRGQQKKYVGQYLDWVETLEGEMPLVASAMETLWEDEGLLLADVHLGNIGWARRAFEGRPGSQKNWEVVIFDLGQSSKRASGGVDLVEACDVAS